MLATQWAATDEFVLQWARVVGTSPAIKMQTRQYISHSRFVVVRTSASPPRHRSQVAEAEERPCVAEHSACACAEEGYGGGVTLGSFSH